MTGRARVTARFGLPPGQAQGDENMQYEIPGATSRSPALYLPG